MKNESATNQFEKQYTRLNAQQKEAVDAIEGPVMVIAGPGTGKTQILTLRIARILQSTDTAPENILALTFTESATQTIRKRLFEMIGTPAYKVKIHTFHGFCNDVIKNYPEEFPNIIGARTASNVDQIGIIESSLESADYALIRPLGDPYYYVNSIISSIRSLKQEGLTAAEFNKATTKQLKRLESSEDRVHKSGAHKGKIKGEYVRLEKILHKNLELASAFEFYESELRAKRLFDYEDMIVEVLKAMHRDSNFLLMLEEEHQYVLADEHQDTNGAQNQILELLTSFHPNPNLFIVGDEKQAIFKFQGASLDNFLYFQKKHPTCRLIALKNNYRSTQSILDAAHGMIGHTKSAAERVRLESQKKTSKPLLLVELESPELEARYIADDIQKEIQAGIDPNEIAVLFRNNKDSELIRLALDMREVLYVLESDEDLNEDPDIRRLMSVLRALRDLGDDEALIAALHADFFGISELDIFKLIKAGRKFGRTLHEIMNSQDALQKADIENTSRIHELHIKFIAWSKLSHNDSALRVLEVVIRESGILQSITNATRAIERLSKIGAFYDEVSEMLRNHANFSLSEFIVYMDSLAKYGVLTKSIKKGSGGGVRLMTAHRSKGLEWNRVYITRLEDGRWGNKSRISLFHISLGDFDVASTKNDDDDERRLLYVAMTRARETVVLTYARTKKDGSTSLPSLFISEIDTELVEKIEIKDETTKTAAVLATKYDARKEGGKIDKIYLNRLFLEQGMSVSALNNYIKCPWHYFYVNLLRVPQSPTVHQMYGTAIHKSLRDYFVKIKTDEKVDASFLTERFISYLESESVSSQDFTQLSKKGEESLKAYISTHNPRERKTLFCEYSVSVPFSVDVDGESATLTLKGNLDRLEDDGSSGVRVVDYKTGKPKSRNELLGLTKNADGNYFRQLVFYKMLLDLSESTSLNMKEGVLDFLDPDKNNKTRREIFEITKSNVGELMELLKKTTSEIINLSFWEKRCDDVACQYCTMRNYLK